MGIKQFSLVSMAAALSLATGQALYAGPVDPFLQAGTNVVEDDSAEQVFRCDLNAAAGSQCTRLAKGAVISPAPFAGGGGESFIDVFAGVLQFPSVNGNPLAAAPAELTGVFVAALDGFAAPGIITESPVGRDIFFELTGVDLNTFTFDVGTAADTMVALYQDNGTGLNDAINASPASFSTALAEATDGDLAALVGRLGNDFFEAEVTTPGGAICTTGPSAGLAANALVVGGCDAAGTNASLFDLTFGLSFQAYEMMGEFIPDSIVAAQPSNFPTQTLHDVSGSGIHRAPDAPAVDIDPDAFDIANDIEAAFALRTPEPGTVALLGLGLIGLGGAARRRRK